MKWFGLGISAKSGASLMASAKCSIGSYSCFPQCVQYAASARFSAPQYEQYLTCAGAVVGGWVGVGYCAGGGAVVLIEKNPTVMSIQAMKSSRKPINTITRIEPMRSSTPPVSKIPSPDFWERMLKALLK